MMPFALYAVKVAACSGIITGYYWLMLRNKKFHQYNRFFILFGFLLSLTLPFLQIPVFTSLQAEKNALFTTLETISVTEMEENATEYITAQASPQWLTAWNLAAVLYITGSLLFCALLIKAFLYIIRISKKYPFEKIGKVQLYQTNERSSPFSFFKKIFWNNRVSLLDEKGQQIFRHEMYHVHHGHSFDILLTEIISVFFWWNPFFYLLRRELKTIHEFLADQYAISNCNKFDYASLLVTQSLQLKTSSITHPFFHNALKRRIAMITQIQDTRFQYLGKILVLPLLTFIVTAFAVKKVATQAHLYNNEKVTVVVDAGHGGTDPGAMGADTALTEAVLTLQIAKKIKQLSGEYGVEVILTREGNEFPGNLNDKDEANRKRIKIAADVQAKLFVSIHASAAPLTSTRSGFHAFTTAKRPDNKSNALASAILQELSGLYQTDTIIKQRTNEGIYVLDKAPCAAVLIECGYITNPADLDYIKLPANQEKIARNILAGIVKYNLFDNAESAIIIEQPSSKPSQAVTPAVIKSVVAAGPITDTLDIAELKKLNPDDISKVEMGKAVFTVTLKNGEKKLFRTADLKESVTLNDKYKATIISKEKTTSVIFSDPSELDKINPEDIASMHIDKKEKKMVTIHLKNGQVMVMDADKVSNYYEHKKGNKVNITASGVSDGETITVTNLKVNKDTTVTDVMITETEQDPEEKQLIFHKTEIEAEYPGGVNAWARYLVKNLRYPAEAAEKNIQGKVVVQFIVDKDGSISDVKAIEGPAALRAESERIVRESGGWIPAIQNGKKVKALKKQPIKFLLESDKKTS